MIKEEITGIRVRLELVEWLANQPGVDSAIDLLEALYCFVNEYKIKSDIK